MSFILILVGCLTAENMNERYAEEFCTYAQECEVLDIEGFSTSKECENEAATISDECDNFDRKMARKCLKQVAELSCEDGLSGPPASCDKVCD